MPEASHPSAENLTAENRTFGVDQVEARNIDEWIESVGRQWGVSQRTLFSVRLCIAELSANVIEHGVAKSGRDHIIVTLTRFDDSVGVEFLDSRAPFNPIGATIAEQPDSIDSAAIGGRGLVLIRAYARDLAYRYDGTYNRVTLRIKSS